MAHRELLTGAFVPPWYESSKDSPRAAVAAVFRDGPDGTEALFIERAAQKGDPWSGQMAFPGGREELEDPSSEATARRETLEEIGLDLSGAAYLGRFDDHDTGSRRIIVTPHGYWLDNERPELTINHEVADVIWVSLGHLADPTNVIDYQYPGLGDAIFPGIVIDGDRVIWGLTLRLLWNLHNRIGTPLPVQLD